MKIAHVMRVYMFHAYKQNKLWRVTKPLKLNNAFFTFLIKNKRITGVTNKQIKELGIFFTPQHPEEELIKAGAIFESKTAFRDVLANLTIVDDESKFVSGQNQNAGHETPQKMMEILKSK